MSWLHSTDWRSRGAKRGMSRRPVRQRSSRGAMDWDDVRVFLAVARGGLDACRRTGARAEPTDHRPPFGRIRGQFWRADLVRPPARGAAPQRRRRATGPGGRERRGCGADVGAAACGCLAGVERHSAGIDRRVCRRVSGSLPVGIDNDGAAARHHAGTGRSRARRQTSRGAKPIWRCATSRRKAATSTFPRLAPSPVRSTGGAMRCGGCVGHLYRRASALCARALGRSGRWKRRKPVALRASSMLMHLEAIRAGTGRGVLPCYVGDGHPLLERLTPPIPEIAAEYWIIVHRDLRRSACVRAVIDWVKALFAEQRDTDRRRYLEVFHRGLGGLDDGLACTICSSGGLGGAAWSDQWRTFSIGGRPKGGS